MCHKKPLASSVGYDSSLFRLPQTRHAESSSFQREKLCLLHFYNRRHEMPSTHPARYGVIRVQ
ncbi:hypothetical protein BK796_07310 [Kosakonia pseudosacchari]|uniref:Uncharacterized protein n=1 Tax=Kosakonia pseudosacchari TaxID=1646340 RepID=A0ABX4ISR2_9ENTR|nr:hypothetical protein BK796_07310 [Kosakonia pseudosacchari]